MLETFRVADKRIFTGINAKTAEFGKHNAMVRKVGEN